MIHDAREVPVGKTIACDVCIIGAGPAGMSVAMPLIDSGKHIVLLESGGDKVEPSSTRLLRGRNIGQPYLPLHTNRARVLGGTSELWTGWCGPLDPIDFEKRDWVPHSGWPFGREVLDPYYRQATRLCQIKSESFDAASWTRDGHAPWPIEDGGLMTKVFQFSPPTHFGRAYREKFEKAENVDVYLHATALDIECRENGTSVKSLRIAAGPGHEVRVQAGQYVLAAGGIDNPRLLLLSRGVHASGIGNEHDLVGRFFMEHPYCYSGAFEANGAVAVNFYPCHDSPLPGNSDDQQRMTGVISPGEALQRREQLLNAGVYLLKRPWFKTTRSYCSPGMWSAARVVDELRNGMPPEFPGHHLRQVISGLPAIAGMVAGKAGHMVNKRYRYALRTFLEPQPNPDSRVTLGDRKDAFGQSLAQLDWRMTDADDRTMRRFHEVLMEQVNAKKLGRVTLFPELRDASRGRPATLTGGSHHIGTTRMHDDPKQGVVDQHGRVHGVHNLYIAGSSVFPTAGHANPTLTIVAMALKLADRLKGIED